VLVERLERQTLADRQIAATLIASGRGADMPDMRAQRAAFDAALVEEPAPVTLVDSEQWELRRALGVA
jgi:hypothetical protein